MNLIVKYLGHIPVAQIVMMRSVVMFVMVFAMLKKKKIPALGSNYLPLVLRGLFGTMGIAFFFYTVQNMPLASAVVVHYLTPIFTAVVAFFLVKEKLSMKQLGYLALCFIGILMIKGFDARVDLVPILIGVLGTVFAALAYNIISMLKKKEHHFVVMFYFPLVTIPLVLVFILITGQWVWCDVQSWLLLSLIGFLTYFAQYFLTKAYQIGDVNRVSIISYLGIVYALFFGFILFDEWYSTMTLLGIGLVLLGVILNILYKSRFTSKSSMK
jgi:drug/metabolite transporter (DMT)-like permease